MFSTFDKKIFFDSDTRTNLIVDHYIYNKYMNTVKPVLRGHLWDK